MNKIQLFELLEKYAPDGQNVNISIEELVEVLFDLTSDPIEQVTEFHKVFGHPVEDEPTYLSPTRFNFRMRVMLEEMREIARAAGRSSLEAFKTELWKCNKDCEHDLAYHDFASSGKDWAPEMLDGMVDLHYFFVGMLLEMGMQNVFYQAFKLVHESNMSKAVQTIDEAEATADKYRKAGVETTITFADGGRSKYGVVYRTDDNKILKGVNWKPADLSTLFIIKAADANSGVTLLPGDYVSENDKNTL